MPWYLRQVAVVAAECPRVVCCPPRAAHRADGPSWQSAASRGLRLRRGEACCGWRWRRGTWWRTSGGGRAGGQRGRRRRGAACRRGGVGDREDGGQRERGWKREGPSERVRLGTNDGRVMLAGAGKHAVLDILLRHAPPPPMPPSPPEQSTPRRRTARLPPSTLPLPSASIRLSPAALPPRGSSARNIRKLTCPRAVRRVFLRRLHRRNGREYAIPLAAWVPATHRPRPITDCVQIGVLDGVFPQEAGCTTLRIDPRSHRTLPCSFIIIKPTSPRFAHSPSVISRFSDLVCTHK